MNARPIARLLAVVAVSGLAAACSNVQEQFGMTKQSPDEFRVVSRAPLTVPPNFALRPPEPGAPRPQEGTPTDQARRTVFRVEESRPPAFEEAMPADGRSQGERALLYNAGVDQSNPDIRLLVDRETNQINAENQSFVDTLVFWREEEPFGDVVDAEAEQRRLREASATGEEVTGEGAPVIERREKAILEGIF